MINLLLDKKIEVPTIAGDKLKVDVPKGFNLKENLMIKGEGMPRFGLLTGEGRGNLIVDMKIKTPKKMSAKVKKILEDLENEVD